MSINRGVDKQLVVYPYNETVLSKIKNKQFYMQYNMYDAQNNYTKYKKADKKLYTTWFHL